MTPEARFALRRVTIVWAGVALVEVALWWLLYRSNYYRPLWSAPALLAPVAGVIGTLHALRVRGRDRRARERRVETRREPAVVAPVVTAVATAAVTPAVAPVVQPADTPTKSPG